MVVVTGIRTAIQIGKVVYKIAQKTGATGKFATKFERRYGRKAAKYGAIAAQIAVGGTVIYDLMTIDQSGQKQIRTPKIGKTRNYMEFPRSKRFRSAKYRNYERCKPREQRYRY